MGIFKPGRPREWDPRTGEGTAPPPGSCGVYTLRQYESGKVDYTGEGDLYTRSMAHKRNGKLTPNHYVSYQVAPNTSSSATRRIIEREKIKKYSPALNKNKGGGGRKSGS